MSNVSYIESVIEAGLGQVEATEFSSELIEVLLMDAQIYVPVQEGKPPQSDNCIQFVAGGHSFTITSDIIPFLIYFSIEKIEVYWQ